MPRYFQGIDQNRTELTESEKLDVVISLLGVGLLLLAVVLITYLVK